MGNRFASGKIAIAMCDRCGFRFKLTALKKQVLKTKIYNLKVCPSCWDPDQPQLQLGMYPVDDPQAVREPRRDLSYVQAGYTGLQLSAVANSTTNSDGTPTGGSRIFQWGWNPVGGSRLFDNELTPNDLVLNVEVGSVTIQTS